MGDCTAIIFYSVGDFVGFFFHFVFVGGFFFFFFRVFGPVDIQA